MTRGGDSTYGSWGRTPLAEPQALARPYSVRSAVVGSTRVARRAGT
jgi:hypothetical protein